MSKNQIIQHLDSCSGRMKDSLRVRSVSSLNLPRAKARGFQGQNQELSGTLAHGQLQHPRRYPWPIPLRGANRSGSGSDPSLEKRTFPITVWLQPRHRAAPGAVPHPAAAFFGPANIKLAPTTLEPRTLNTIALGMDAALTIMPLYHKKQFCQG